MTRRALPWLLILSLVGPAALLVLLNVGRGETPLHRAPLTVATAPSADPVPVTVPTPAGTRRASRESRARLTTPPPAPSAPLSRSASAAPTPARPTTKPHVTLEAHREPATNVGTWDRLASCESTNRWNYNGSSGYGGGLQFHPSTWREYAPTGYPPFAWQATKAQQIAVAVRVLAAQGWEAWPACSRELGYR